MATLTRANEELFRRTPDQCFATFDALYQKCQDDQDSAEDQWILPQNLVVTHDLTVSLGDTPDYNLNDWSFSQLCRTARVHKDTINRLSPKTASKALEETLPSTADKPYQILTVNDEIRSVHGVAYTRIWNTEMLDIAKEFASDFVPPQTAADGESTGLYCGEQDMFAFLIDPTGWAEIEGEAFAPGFFLWNSEVGRRTMGVQTFWFQKVCRNHIVWDATEVVEFNRKHTANVRDGLPEVRNVIESLIAMRDERRDGFVNCVRKAMREMLGHDDEQVLSVLTKEGVPRHLIKDAMEIARQHGAFTIFALVDALTQVTQRVQLAGDRTEMDAKVGKLLSLALAV